MQRVKQRGERGLVALLAVAGLLLSACAQAASEAESSHGEPAKVEAVSGSDLSRITLTERAIERIDLKTAKVTGGKAAGTVVPYGAVVYDPSGATWVYTSPKDRVFLRAGITVDRIDGDMAVLSDGPAAGTVVVSVGAAELYGAELGIDH
jgi:hypothetical protein